jgi:hypothetical protein
MTTVPDSTSASRRRSAARLGLDGFDLAVLCVLAVLSMAMVAFLLWRTFGSDLTWTGTDGLNVLDQMQYVGWIRRSSETFLVANLYRLEDTPASFLHPGVVLSGLLVRLGVAPWLAYLLWKPVAVVALFATARAYVRSALADTLGRRCALVLALFMLAPAGAIATSAGEDVGSWFVGAGDPDIAFHITYLETTAHDMWPVFQLWGYPFAVIALAAHVAAVLAYVADRKRGRAGPRAGALGLLAAWLQPWQGVILAGTLLGTELALWRAGGPDRGHRARLLALSLALTAMPLLYYAALGRWDENWRIAHDANTLDGGWPWWTIALSLAPLAVPALLAYRRRPAGAFDVALLLWPPVAIATYTFIASTNIGTFPLHALWGLSVPLAVLAVRGVQSLRLRPRRPALVAGLVVTLLTVPAGVWELQRAADSIQPSAPWYLTPGERAALDHVERRSGDGGVLAAWPMGLLIPAETGRPTWVGALSWTPDYLTRAALTDRLYGASEDLKLRPSGPRMTTLEGRRFVRSTKARFVVRNCSDPSDLRPTLVPIARSVRYFVCAVVYELDPDPGRP